MIAWRESCVKMGCLHSEFDVFGCKKLRRGGTLIGVRDQCGSL